MNPSSYPGNSALPAEVRERVLSTFRQVAQSYLRGNPQEAAIGCDFILRIDPDFAPARQLSRKLQDDSAPVDVEQLLADLPSSGPAPDASASPLEAAQAALERREFARAMDLASQILRSDLTNADAQRIATEAQNRIEADPFVRQFLTAARQKLASNNRTGARSDLEKAKHLDQQHPEVLDFERRLGQAPPPEPPPQQLIPEESSGFGVPVIGGGEQPPSDEPLAGQADDAPAGGFDFGFGSPEPAAEAFPEPEISFGESEPSYTTTPSFASFDTDTAAAGSPTGAPDDGFSFGFDSPASGAGSGAGRDDAGTPDGFGDAFGGFGAPEPSSESFVVPDVPGDAPEQGSSEFGFTFEDDSAQPPPPPPAKGDPEAFGAAFSAPAGEGQTFDFSTASVETSEEERQRIDQHLKEGDQAFERGEYQNAIDIWSRIFLLDVTNDAASERIEKARGRKQEAEATIDGLMTEGTFELEGGNLAAAREKFEEVLRIDPGHFGARDSIERLEAGEQGLPLIPPPPPGDSFADGAFEAGDAPAAVDRQRRTAARPDTAARGRSKSSTSRRPVLMVIAVVVVLAIAAVAWLLLSRPDAATAEINSVTQIEHAERLAGRGEFEAAIAALLAVPAGDPNHIRALELIDEYRKQRTAASAATAGRPAAEVYAEHVALGRQAFEGGDYVAARAALTQAGQVQALAPDLQQMLNVSAQKVAALEPARTMLQEERWGDAITALEQLRAQDPGNANVRSMLAGAHFNRGVTALRGGNTSSAAAAFGESIRIEPGDPLAVRSRELATRYDGREKDLLYQIYVKYLPLRTF